tara:strand:+ start:1245 stop:1622 length:378 start_codon:yes stop_codon:yes gene_type:complete
LSHFAKVENGIVANVIVAEQEFIDKQDGTWVQTSYNTREGVHYGQDGNDDGGVALRFRYSGIGMVYDSTNDVFYEPKPFASWTLNTSTWIWDAPINYPSDGTPFKVYNWDEDAYQADNNTGWVNE